MNPHSPHFLIVSVLIPLLFLRHSCSKIRETSATIFPQFNSSNPSLILASDFSIVSSGKPHNPLRDSNFGRTLKTSLTSWTSGATADINFWRAVSSALAAITTCRICAAKLSVSCSFWRRNLTNCSEERHSSISASVWQASMQQSLRRDVINFWDSMLKQRARSRSLSSKCLIWFARSLTRCTWNFPVSLTLYSA